MRLFKKNFLIIFLLFSSSLLGRYEIIINFESGFEYKSQEKLFRELQNEPSKRRIQNLIQKQDWIEEYSIVFKPFQYKAFISIKNRDP